MEKEMSKCSQSKLRASDSRDLGLVDSFSLPSEPPDIRNWFSSYVYESPELNTLDGFKDFDVSGETCVEDVKKDTISCGRQSVGKLDDALIDAPEKPSDGVGCNEAHELKHGNSSSLIKRFFAKNGVCIRLVDGRKRKVCITLVDGGSVCLSDDDIECNNFNANKKRRIIKDRIQKVTESSESLSFLSEPPDIKEWFSSYVYESPTLDTTDGFAILDYKESEDGKLCNVQVNCRHDKKDVAFCAEERIELCSQQRQPSVVIKCTDSVKDPELDYQSVTKDVHNVALKPMPTTLSQLTCDKISNSTLSELRRQSNNHNKVDDDDDDENLHLSSTDERSPISLNGENNIGSLNGESVVTSIGRIEAVKEKVEKENDETELSEDGFISIRKKSCEVSDWNVTRCIRVNGVELKRNQEKDDNIVRKVLSEISNFSSGSKGKWQCPQRNKPELGPPLKQLRLDQWFNRQ